MTVERISFYQYTYGSGNEPNRVVEFYKNSAETAVEARVKTLGEQAILLSVVPASQITVEEDSTTAKQQALMQAYQTGQPYKIKVKRLSDWGVAFQITLVQQVKANFSAAAGKYRIDISNEIGGHEGKEKPVRLNLFDPS